MSIKLTLLKSGETLISDIRELVSQDSETGKKEAISLLKYKKKAEKGVKWRVVLRTIKEKKIA